MDKLNIPTNMVFFFGVVLMNVDVVATHKRKNFVLLFFFKKELYFFVIEHIFFLANNTSVGGIK